MKTSSCESAQKIISEVVTIVSKYIVLIGPVAWFHLGEKNVEYFVSGELADIGKSAGFRVLSLIAYWNRALVRKMSITSRSTDVDA